MEEQRAYKQSKVAINLPEIISPVIFHFMIVSNFYCAFALNTTSFLSRGTEKAFLLLTSITKHAFLKTRNIIAKLFMVLFRLFRTTLVMLFMDHSRLGIPLEGDMAHVMEAHRI